MHDGRPTDGISDLFRLLRSRRGTCSTSRDTSGPMNGCLWRSLALRRTLANARGPQTAVVATRGRARPK